SMRPRDSTIVRWRRCPRVEPSWSPTRTTELTSQRHRVAGHHRERGVSDAVVAHRRLLDVAEAQRVSRLAGDVPGAHRYGHLDAEGESDVRAFQLIDVVGLLHVPGCPDLLVCFERDRRADQEAPADRPR